MNHRPQFIYIHESHLDLFWLGNYHTCLERGNHILKQYMDRCTAYEDETFLIETVVFLKHFLQTYPDYKETVKHLWSKGQLDIGCAYIDVWQNIVLGESHVMNLVEGRRWLKQELGIDSQLASHPDLPGLTPQTAQIYTKAGVKYYATSRKNFHNGAVWIYVAPDGSEMMVLNHPRQYIFNPLEGDEVSKDRNDYIRIEQTLEGFPLQKVILSGGTGDLADMRNFKRRMGRDLRETLVDYKYQYPQIDFSFGTIDKVLNEYEEVKQELPHLRGEIPSVWGIDESIAFFHTARFLEGKLLSAGYMEALGKLYGLDSFDLHREPWFGIYHEGAFFREKDPIEYGDELPSLWRMHLFTQDHNGGGQEGALSEFQKRTIQDRAINYCDQMIRHYMKSLAANLNKGIAVNNTMNANADILLVNPLNTSRYEPIEIEVSKDWLNSEFILTRPDGSLVPWQSISMENPAEEFSKIVVACPLEGGSYSVLKMGTRSKPNSESNSNPILEEQNYISVDAEYFSIKVNRSTGALESLLDKKTGMDWGSNEINRLYAIQETKNDTALRADEANILETALLESVEVIHTGPMFVKIKICKSILKASVEQIITVWLHGLNMMDISTTVWWHGMHNIQLRQCLPTTASRDHVSYGTPFYGNGWMDTMKDSGPNAIDELSPEDYPFYREVQMWLYQSIGGSGLGLATHHPTFHWGQSGLEALLIRTPQSCGDPRFFWENSGKQEFNFRLKIGNATESTGWAYAMGQQVLCPVLSAVISEDNDNVGGRLSEEDIIIKIDANNLLVTSVYSEPEGFVVRIVETEGILTVTHLKIKGLQHFEQVTLDGVGLGTISGDDHGCLLEVSPYEIVTIRCS